MGKLFKFQNTLIRVDKGFVMWSFNFGGTKSNRLLPVRKVFFLNGMMASLQSILIIIKTVEITFMSE